MAAPKVLKIMSAAMALVLSVNLSALAQTPPDNTPGQNFDPATRAFRNLKSPLGSSSDDANGGTQLTPEQQAAQQAEIERQRQMAEMQAKLAAAKQRAVDNEKIRKDKLATEKEAQAKRMAEVKSARSAKLLQEKENHEELKKLIKEEQSSRKTYQESLKNVTGTSRKSIEDEYKRAEIDRRKKIAELRHPKYQRPVKTTTTTETVGPNGNIALPGTTTTGSGPNAVVH